MTSSKRKLAEDLLKRLRIENGGKFHSLIKLHISFCIELTTDELDALNLQNGDAHLLKRRSTRLFASKLNYFHLSRKSCSSSGTFGFPLTREGVAEISQLITFFLEDEKNLLEEGLFRKSGSLSRQTELRNVLNLGDTIDLSTGRFSVHDVATVLKFYLQELPEPLLTEAHFPIYMKMFDFVQDTMSKSEKCSAKNRQLRLIRLLILLLPEEIRDFLKQILFLLKSVAGLSSINKMNAENLGKIFGPLLLCHKNMAPNELKVNAEKVAFIVTMQIDHYDEIFQAPKELLKDVLGLYEETSAKTYVLSSTTGDVISTSVAFVDQARSMGDSSKYNTTTALAQLYAHVQMMPEGPQKMKLLKQFQGYNRESMGVSSNGPVKQTVKATSALKRKLNSTRSSLLKIKSRRSSQSSIETASSDWSTFSQTNELSFVSTSSYLSGQSSVTKISKEESFCDNTLLSTATTPLCNSTLKEPDLQYTVKDLESQPQTICSSASNAKKTTPKLARKSCLRNSCQYNFRKSFEVFTGGVVIEKL